MKSSLSFPSRPLATLGHALTCAALASLAVACGGSSKTEAESPKTEADADDPLAGAPVWVTADCRDHFKGKSVLCGVGSVSDVPSPSLARNTAMARGRTEIARFLQIEVKSVLTDYQAVKGTTTEQLIEEQSKQITEMTLNGTRMASSFVGKDKTYYALMVLDLEAFSTAVKDSPDLEEPLREALIQHMGKTFSSKDSETSRY